MIQREDGDGVPNACDTDYIPCVDYISNLDNAERTNSLRVEFELISNEIIPVNSVVEFTAGQSIELVSGFEVVNAATFDAYIEDCSQN